MKHSINIGVVIMSLILSGCFNPKIKPVQKPEGVSRLKIVNETPYRWYVSLTKDGSDEVFITHLTPSVNVWCDLSPGRYLMSQALLDGDHNLLERGSSTESNFEVNQVSVWPILTDVNAR